MFHFWQNTCPLLTIFSTLVQHCTNVKKMFCVCWTVAETGFSHRLSLYKIEAHLFGRSYLRLLFEYSGRFFFFRINDISITCPHDQLTGRTVIKKLWIFFGLEVQIALSHRHVDFFRVKQIHQSTASG